MAEQGLEVFLENASRIADNTPDGFNGLNLRNIASVDSEMYNLITSNMKGIFGMPYQFMPSVDRRVNVTEFDNNMGNCNKFGRKYAEKIVSRMPLLFLTPGNPSFLKGYDKNSKGIILEAFGNVIGGNDVDDIESVISSSGKFYAFEFAYADYFRYVNSLLNSVAVLLGIGDVKIPKGNGKKEKLKYFDWSKAVNSSFKQYFSAKEAIPFYMDSETSISESFGNDTTDSSLASKVNDKASETREWKYVLGGITGIDTNQLAESVGLTGESAINIPIFHSAAAGLSAVASGGKLIFPKMWSDSDYSRSYSINFKFRSPDHDTLSIYLNLLVPYFHLIAMAAPHSSGVNGLEAPFLVRGFYKGFFNCDMGIITSLSCTKGAEGQWNNDGLPTVMDVSITLEDLYTNMTITDAFGKGKGPIRGTISQESVKQFIRNTNLIDYLCMSSGLNLNTPEVHRLTSVYVALAAGKVKNYPNRVFTKLEQNVSNMISDVYSKFNIF